MTSTSLAINPPRTRGFWSYVHKDDEAEGGRIRQLAADVADQFEMLTGDVLQFFLDRNALQWGDDWKQRIDEAIAAGDLFIPILTPRYFMSPECRRELTSFARQAINLGVKDLVLPIYYVTVPELDNQTTKDELLILVRTFQWEDWRELRFKDRSSGDYRSAVARLANRLVVATQRAELEAPRAIAASPESSGEGEDSSPGLIDRLAILEKAMPELTNTLDEITADMNLVGELTVQATADIERVNKQALGFAVRVEVARRLAQQLAEPAQRVSLAADRYVSQLNQVDDGIRVLIEFAPIGASQDSDVAKNACALFMVIRRMASSSLSSQASLQKFVTGLVPIEEMARDLRPPLRRLREGLTKLIEGGQVVKEWIGLVDASELHCPEEVSELTH